MVRKLLKQGRLAHVRIGRSRRIEAAGVETFERENRVDANG